MSLQSFHAEAVRWIKANCPDELFGLKEPIYWGGSKLSIRDPAKQTYFDAMVERGWTVPTWSEEHGGAGLNAKEHNTLQRAMIETKAPVPLAGMGVTMIGPTLLEFGTDAQKERHLRPIARGERAWCQGYSEPGAGSDLASLSTRAEDCGDHFLINGSKIWTSGAQYADWIFCLVRTNTQVPKHDGISFVLFEMDQPGVTVKPIQLISGNSAFCECFFDDVKALKEDLVGELDRGWGIGKRLLQYERSSLFSRANLQTPIPDIAREYIAEQDGKLADPGLRAQVLSYEFDLKALALTQKRAREENASGGTPTHATSMFKLFGSELVNRRAELIVSMLGHQGLGWEGPGFSADELQHTRNVLSVKSGMIAGGSSEVQRNIIAKRVLGLPD